MRKKLILKGAVYLLIIVLSLSVNAQDFITFPNGTFVKAKIMEIGVAEIKYKLFNSTNDQLYSVARNQVYNVRYENGVIDFLNGRTIQPAITTNLTNVETFKTPQVAATTAPKAAKKATPTNAGTAKPITPTTATTAVPADLSKQLNLTPEQLQILKNMLDANAAAATAQQNTTSTAVQPTAIVAAQSVSPTQVQAYNPAMASGITGSAQTNQNSQPAKSIVSSLMAPRASSGNGMSIGKTRRPTAFRDYKSHIDFGGVSESYYDEYTDGSIFLGFTLTGESSIGKSDFGIGVDANFLSSSYYLNSLDLDTEYASNYTDIGLRLSYHLPLSTFIDPYIAIRGFYYDDEAYEDSDFDTDLIIGGRLMYKSFGLFYEYHFNYEYSKFGISFSLK